MGSLYGPQYTEGLVFELSVHAHEPAQSSQLLL